ncbi:hypothetical protein JCGZ_14816 [Jatropha curcas]|uniref:DNA2/NAM7 helicase-like C-terminal domain-containing protein n=1 Tax=Jatropha curcas TaxID=180498 RepID=A0A067K5T7_JATCU|nr:hypothetical protein JCGZ_14816 [Jatropha curcas]
MECRTLVYAPTEVAIAELASRVLKLLKESNALSSVSRILYFGDNTVPSVNADIQEICLDQVGSEDNFLQIRSASLIFCTASSSYKLCSVLTEAPRLLVIDEAAQLKECESVIPLQLPGVRHTVLFGDHCQQMAKVTSNVSGRAAFGRSLFERLLSIGHSKHILNMQYRMHPFISYLPNSEFYCNQISNAPTWSGSKQKLSVGIASPYTAQVVAIKEKVGRKYESLDGFSLKVNTIDGFQGGEEDVMILSTVRSNTDESVGLIFNRQRTNLALTRARSCFWIVGDGKALSNINSVWKLIVQDAKDRQCFYNAEEDEELANVVLEVKEELNQFYDILNADGMLFKNARWKVIFSDIFKQSFQKLKPLETKKLVINLLLRLSCGWRPKRRNTNLASDNSFQMLKLFKVKHLHIICTTDITKDLEYTQVLKIWDILPLEVIPNLAKRLNSVFESYTDGFINRCKFKFLEGGSKQKLSVGIASPYTAQVVAIKEKVGRKYESLDGFSLKVNTIDGFQGGEEDVMILSTVRSNTDESVGLIFNRQRTNLALTRARSCFWIVGDGKALSNINSVWKLIVQDAKDRQCFYNAEEDEELANVVLEVKEELNQFYDILNADGMLFKNARWKVIFSDIFKQSFQKLKPLETKKLVINLLLRLSCGWRPKRRNTNLASDNSFQMLKLFKVKHLHIICTTDITKDLEYTQVLKIWDILPLEVIPNLAKRLNSVFESYTDGFINRCKFKFLEGDLEFPMSWSSYVARYKDPVQRGNDSRTSDSDETGCVEICKASDSLLHMKFYALSSGVVSHLLTGCDGNEMDFPFELTDEEMEVIHFRKSSFILGRSGTGKTTVLIMKLFQREQLYHLASEGYHEVESSSTNNVSCGSEVQKKENILRQIFVTVNVRLCYAVSEYISRLKRSTCG